jgi:hypothetical protein
MRKKHVYSDLNNNYDLFEVIYPRGNNNFRKLQGKHAVRRVHLYEERRKNMRKKYGCV